MSSADHVRHLGPVDFHDGTIVAVERTGDRVRGAVRGASGRHYVVAFSGVVALDAVRAEGMLLYALSELPVESDVRRFTFTNWDEADDARLEIAAAGLQVEPLGAAG